MTRGYDSTMTAPLTQKARTTRAALVRSAYDAFIEQGYGAVSVRDLARRTEVTSGAIYGHFRNKADLLVAAIAEHIDADLYLPPNGESGLRNYLRRQWRSYRVAPACVPCWWRPPPPPASTPTCVDS